MKSQLKSTALRHKLLWIYSLFVIGTFALGFSGLLALQRMNARTNLVEQLRVTTALTTPQIVSALAARKSVMAIDTMKLLASNPNIRGVTIFKPDGSPFAEYHRPGETPRPRPQLPELHRRIFDATSENAFSHRYYHEFTDGQLVLTHPIFSHGTYLGTLFIDSDLRALHADTRNAIFLTLSIMIPCMVLSLIIVRRIVNAVSQPIENLASTATAVALEHDYSLRASKFSNDELGQLADAFNEMMATIEFQSSQIKEQHAKLARSTRMESLGLLAGGVAHDLNNILGPMVAFPDLIAERLEPGDSVREEILMIGQSAKRASVVIQDLLSLARRGNYELKVSNLPDLLKDCLNSPAFTARAQENGGITIRTAFDENLPAISGSEPHLTQMILNLLLNGLEAMNGKGVLTISARLEKVTNSGDHFERIEPGTYVALSIADTGLGIRSSDLEHIFEPFYSSKKMGDRSGSGLGLAVVYGVVKDHDAKIDVLSVVGQGTEFKILFKPSEASIREVPDKAPPIHGCEHILIVDDYGQQRILTEKILQIHGYSTTGASNGREAVRLLQDHRFDLMVLDMIMEDDFDGLDTYQECVALHPTIKCVIATGFSENERVKEALSLGASQCLHKPYTPRALAVAVRQALDENFSAAVDDLAVK